MEGGKRSREEQHDEEQSSGAGGNHVLEQEIEVYAQKCQSMAEAALSSSRRIKAAREDLLEELNRREEALNKKLQKLDEMEALIREWNSVTTLSLNIGGQVFSVSSAAVQKHPLSLFGTMLKSERPPANGVHFVDRNAAAFPLVLDYLRGEDLREKLVVSDRAVLRQAFEDAAFYNLPELADLLRDHVEDLWTICPTANGTILDGGITLVKTGDMGKKSCISLGSVGWCEGVHQFGIKFNGEGKNVGVGVTRGGIHQTDLLKNVQLFYALDCGNGRAVGMGQGVQVFQDVAGTGFPADSVVMVKLDMNGRTVSFGINGTWAPPAFSDIPLGVYYPYFFLGAMEKKLTLIRRFEQ